MYHSRHLGEASCLQHHVAEAEDRGGLHRHADRGVDSDGPVGAISFGFGGRTDCFGFNRAPVAGSAKADGQQGR